MYAKNMLSPIGFIVYFGIALPLAAQDKTPSTAPPASEPPGAQAQNNLGQAAQAQTASQARQQFELSDMALARWLLIEQRSKIEISNFAEQRTQNPQVKQFAGRVAQSHAGMLQRLQQFADEVPGAAQQAGQLDETLQDLGESLQDRLDQPGRLGLGLRGDRNAANEAEAQTPGINDRNSLRERRQAAREQRQGDDGNRLRRVDRDDVGDDESQRQIEERREERQETVDERREERQEELKERQAIRDQRRQELRGFLRDNLPEVLDVVGQAIQAEAQQTVNSPWLQFKQQLSERNLASLKKELGRYQGAEFDQAYLGYQLVAHLRMIDAFELAQQSASDDLRQALADGTVMAQDHLQQARQLMEQLARKTENH